MAQGCGFTKNCRPILNQVVTAFRGGESQEPCGTHHIGIWMISEASLNMLLPTEDLFSQTTLLSLGQALNREKHCLSRCPSFGVVRGNRQVFRRASDSSISIQRTFTLEEPSFQSRISEKLRFEAEGWAGFGMVRESRGGLSEDG